MKSSIDLFGNQGEEPLGNFDIQSAFQEILSTGDPVETDQIGMANGMFDGHESNILVKGNVTSGAVIKGQQSLLVNGCLMGSKRAPCRVNVDEDVVIRGDIEHAYIRARSIWVGANIRHSQLTSARGIKIGGDVSGTRISVGEYGSQRMAIARLKQTGLRMVQEKRKTEDQLDFEQRRVYRELHGTRFNLEFSIGQVVRHKIIQHGRKQIVIDLQPLYEVVGSKREDETDRAIMEFFSTAVVGQLVRVNRERIQISPHRKMIFMGVIRRLNDLFSLVRKRDKLSDQIVKDKEKVEKLMDTLFEQKVSSIYIGGEIRPNIDLQFVQPEVSLPNNKEIMIGTQTAKLTVRYDLDSHDLEVKQQDIAEVTNILSCKPEEMEGILFRLREGRIEWERTAET